jgi:hypothetical protein
MTKKEAEEKPKTVAVTVKNVSPDKHFKMAPLAVPPPKHFSAGATGYVAVPVADLAKEKEREEKAKAGKPDELLLDLAPGEEKTIEVSEEQMHLLTPTLDDAQMRGFITWSAPGHLSGKPHFQTPGGTVVANRDQHAGMVALAESDDSASKPKKADAR